MNPHEQDLDMEIETQYKPQIEAIVDNVFEGSEVGNVEWFGRGYNSVAFDVELKNPPKQVVVKIVEKEYSEDAREKEKNVWELLREKYPEFPVPEVYAFDTSKTVIEKSYSVLERLDGEPLSQAWDEIPNQGEVFREIGEYTGMIHAITYDSYGSFSPELELEETYDDWQGKYSERVDKILGKLKNRDYVDEEFVQAQSDFWEANKHLLANETSPVLCWGDVGMGNMIVKKGEDGNYHISGLIDFEYTHVGGAVRDVFARVRAFEHHYKHRQDIYEGHTQYAPLPDNYAELAQLYHWMASLGELSKVPGMQWHDLSEADTEARKKEIIANNKKRVSDVLQELR